MKKDIAILSQLKEKESSDFTTLLEDASIIIEQAKVYAYRSVNTLLTMRNWLIGKRIDHDLLGEECRAKYGEQIIGKLAENLTNKYGKGFDKVSLNKYVKFSRLFPEIGDSLGLQSIKLSIRDSLSPQFQLVDFQKRPLLPWTHYRELIRIDNGDARKWYEQEALRENWSVRTLHRNIGSQYYFRLLQSTEKEPVIEEMHRMTSAFQSDPKGFIKNPVIAEFLGFSRKVFY